MARKGGTICDLGVVRNESSGDILPAEDIYLVIGKPTEASVFIANGPC